MSVFIPAINLVTLENQVQTLAKKLSMELTGRERIENGKLGIRYWRVM